MKKLLILPLSLVLLLMSFVCFVSCTEEVDKEINTITDFSNFSSLTRATDRIEVTFDNHSGAPFYFTIEDKEDIDEIINIQPDGNMAKPYQVRQIKHIILKYGLEV